MSLGPVDPNRVQLNRETRIAYEAQQQAELARQQEIERVRKEQELRAKQEQEAEESARQQAVVVTSRPNRNAFFNEAKGAWDFIVEPTYEDITGSRAVTKDEINPDWLNSPAGANAKSFFDKADAEQKEAQRQAETQQDFALYRDLQSKGIDPGQLEVVRDAGGNITTASGSKNDLKATVNPDQSLQFTSSLSSPVSNDSRTNSEIIKELADSAATRHTTPAGYVISRDAQGNITEIKAQEFAPTTYISYMRAKQAAMDANVRAGYEVFKYNMNPPIHYAVDLEDRISGDPYDYFVNIGSKQPEVQGPQATEQSTFTPKVPSDAMINTLTPSAGTPSTQRYLYPAEQQLNIVGKSSGDPLTDIGSSLYSYYRNRAMPSAIAIPGRGLYVRTNPVYGPEAEGPLASALIGGQPYDAIGKNVDRATQSNVVGFAGTIAASATFFLPDLLLGGGGVGAVRGAAKNLAQKSGIEVTRVWPKPGAANQLRESIEIERVWPKPKPEVKLDEATVTSRVERYGTTELPYVDVKRMARVDAEYGETFARVRSTPTPVKSAYIKELELESDVLRRGENLGSSPIVNNKVKEAVTEITIEPPKPRPVRGVSVLEAKAGSAGDTINIGTADKPVNIPRVTLVGEQPQEVLAPSVKATSIKSKALPEELQIIRPDFTESQNVGTEISTIGIDFVPKPADGISISVTKGGLTGQPIIRAENIARERAFDLQFGRTEPPNLVDSLKNAYRKRAEIELAATKKQTQDAKIIKKNQPEIKARNSMMIEIEAQRQQPRLKTTSAAKYGGVLATKPAVIGDTISVPWAGGKRVNIPRFDRRGEIPTESGKDPLNAFKPVTKEKPVAVIEIPLSKQEIETRLQSTIKGELLEGVFDKQAYEESANKLIAAKRAVANKKTVSNNPMKPLGSDSIGYRSNPAKSIKTRLGVGLVKGKAPLAKIVKAKPAKPIVIKGEDVDIAKPAPKPKKKGTGDKASSSRGSSGQSTVLIDRKSVAGATDDIMVTGKGAAPKGFKGPSSAAAFGSLSRSGLLPSLGSAVDRGSKTSVRDVTKIRSQARQPTAEIGSMNFTALKPIEVSKPVREIGSKLKSDTAQRQHYDSIAAPNFGFKQNLDTKFKQAMSTPPRNPTINPPTLFPTITRPPPTPTRTPTTPTTVLMPRVLGAEKHKKGKGKDAWGPTKVTGLGLRNPFSKSFSIKPERRSKRKSL